MHKVTSLIDIKAPCRDVFNTVVNLERRMQLSPLWGLSRVLEVAPDFPNPGSSYRVRILSGAPFGLASGTLNVTQSALSGLAQFLSLKLGQNHVDQSLPNVPQQPLAKDELKSTIELPEEQEYIIEEYQPPHKLSYHLDNDCKTIVTWRFQSIPFGTRVNYEEVFCVENTGDENFIPTVRHVISEWLNNIKRYSELRGGRGRLLVKWFLDRVYLRLRPDQRRVVLILLFMQAIGLATFVTAVVGWGIASLFF